MKERQEVIKNDKLKKLLLKKLDLVEEKNVIMKEGEVWREQFVKRLEKVKDKINKTAEQAIKASKKIEVLTSEYEEIRSVEVVKGELVLNIVDKIAEFKDAYTKAREDLEK